MEMNLKDFNDKYIRREKAYRKQIETLERKRKAMRWPDFFKTFKPLFDAIKDELGADRIEQYGPFGLSSERSVYFNDGDDNTLGSLCFIRADEGFQIRDMTKDTGEYAVNTMGEMNGMNYPRIEITDEMSFEWLINHAKGGVNHD